MNYRSLHFHVGNLIFVFWVGLISCITSSAQSLIYVTRALSASISVIDGATNTVIDTIPLTDGLPANSYGGQIAITPDGHIGLVMTSHGFLAAIDLRNKTTLYTIGAFDGSEKIALTPDGAQAWVPNARSGLMYVIDTASGHFTTFPTGVPPGVLFPMGSAVTPNASRAYVTSAFGVEVLDAANRIPLLALSPMTDIAGIPLDLAITPDGSRVWIDCVVAATEASLTVVNASDGHPITSVPVGSLSYGIAISPDGSQVYVTNNFDNTVTIVDANTYRFSPIHVGSGPRGVAVSRDGTRVYTANYAADTVSVVDPVAKTTLATIRVGDGPWAIATAPKTGGTPSLNPGGIVPVYSPVSVIQPGSWISLYGANLANGTATWKGDFPTSLGGVSVTIDGKPAYLWFVGPTQINLQVPDTVATGPVDVVINTPGGTVRSTVTVAPFAPSLSRFDARRVAAEIVTPDGSGAYGGGTYDLAGPVGQFSFRTRPARPGENLSLFGVGFGPTNPGVPAGKIFSGAAPTANPVQVTIGGLPAVVTFSGMVGAGLYQLNVIVPAAPSGDQLIEAKIGDVKTPPGAYIAIQ